MYKKQMILQRIVCYATLIAAALVFIYSLGLMTDMYDMKLNYYAEDLKNPMVQGAEVYYNMQGFNRSLTMAGIYLILLAVSQFLFQNHNRRKYYIANYITICANVVAAVAASMWAWKEIFIYKEQFLQIDFETMKMYADIFEFPYSKSTYWFDLSKGVFGILLAVAVFNVLNLIMKVYVMSAEKKLLKGKGV